jgi:HEAT repeat protein
MSDLHTKSPEHFLDSLKRRNLEGKRALIADLRRRQTEKSVELLVDLLEDESWYLRELAVEALADAGEAAIPRIYAILESGLWYSRAAAARAIGRIGHVESLGKLVEMLDEANSTVRDAALASVADMVVAGQARETAALFWGLGRRRAEELRRDLEALHGAAGRKIGEYLDNPSSFLEAVPQPDPAPEHDTDDAPAPEYRKNA